MASEINEESTTEEIAEFTEQVAREVAAERAGTEDRMDGKLDAMGKLDGTEKDDARITSEHADNEHKETPAEKPSGSEPADKGEEEAKADDTGQSWLDEDLKAEAAAYGIEESEISDFASGEELERALRIFDKSALDTGRKAMAESDGDSKPKQDDKGRSEKKQEPQEGQYEIKLDDDYDEDIVGEFTRMRDHYESRFDSLEKRFHEADTQAEEKHFDSLVDSMGHADLFGKTDQENPKQLERRNDLMVQVKALMNGLAQLGRPAELNDSLINRVARMVFAEELGKKDLKKRTRKISRQSDGRQGGGTTRAQDPREEPRDEFDRIFNEMDAGQS